MMASPHILASAALSKGIKDPYLLAFLAIILHFLVDVIPHWNYRPFEGISKKRSYFYLLLDHIIGIGIILIIGFLLGWTKSDFWLAFLAAFFGLLPDVFSKSFKHYILKENKYALMYRRFHRKLHIIYIDDYRYGIAQQIAISLISIVLIGMK